MAMMSRMLLLVMVGWVAARYDSVVEDLHQLANEIAFFNQSVLMSLESKADDPCSDTWPLVFVPDCADVLEQKAAEENAKCIPKSKKALYWTISDCCMASLCQYNIPLKSLTPVQKSMRSDWKVDAVGDNSRHKAVPGITECHIQQAMNHLAENNAANSACATDDMGEGCRIFSGGNDTVLVEGYKNCGVHNCWKEGFEGQIKYQWPTKKGDGVTSKYTRRLLYRQFGNHKKKLENKCGPELKNGKPDPNSPCRRLEPMPACARPITFPEQSTYDSQTHKFGDNTGDLYQTLTPTGSLACTLAHSRQDPEGITQSDKTGAGITKAYLCGCKGPGEADDPLATEPPSACNTFYSKGFNANDYKAMACNIWDEQQPQCVGLLGNYQNTPCQTPDKAVDESSCNDNTKYLCQDDDRKKAEGCSKI